MSDSTRPLLRACPTCGLVQRLPPVPPRMCACCARCGTTLHDRRRLRRSNSRTAAVALAALILYPFAVSLPILSVEEFGHRNESSILEGTASLLGSGQLFAGLVVMICSVILPPGKLLALLVLSTGGLGLRRRHRAWTYRIVEWTGRWGMLDVLLVALLVAVLKLGDMVEVKAGPAALAFTTCVVLSLVATAFFEPRLLWEMDGDRP